MNNHLNIALFTDSFLPGCGGTEMAVYNLAAALIRHGHNVLVVAPHYNKKKECDNYTFAVFRQNSIRIDSNDYYAIPTLNKKLKQALANFKPDIIHCHSQASMLSLALKAARYLSIPCISTIHTRFSIAYYIATHSKFLTKIGLKMIGKKLKKADLVTAVTYKMNEEFAKYGYTGDFEVIKNGACFTPVTDVDQNKLLAKTKFGFLDSDNILLFVGHISKIKNIQFIFNTLDNLYNTNKDFKMIFVGSGESNKQYKKLAESKPYKNNVRFLGQISDRSLLSSIYANAKLFIFPSIFDTDGLTIVESAINKVPSIVIENTSASERITNGQNGFTSPNNPILMAKLIDNLLRHPQIIQEVGNNASLQLPKTWDETAIKYINLYQHVIANRN